jgi:hypothetical protein
LVDFTYFMIFSVLETYAMFYLMFKLFKIDLLPKEMLLSAVVMSFVSHTLRTMYGFLYLDVVAQFSLMICFVWMLFRIHIYYAAIMTGMAYQAYMLIQTLSYFLLGQLGLFSIPIPSVSSISIYILQVFTASSAILIGWWVARKRKGFDFVPDKPSGRIRMKRRDVVLLALNLPSFMVIVVTMYLIENVQRIYYGIPFAYAAILAIYLHLSYKKDWNQDEPFG